MPKDSIEKIKNRLSIGITTKGRIDELRETLKLLENSELNVCNIILIDDFIKQVKLHNYETPKVNVTSRNLAYAIFTSGTTGKPKGVMIEHHSVMNRIGWMQNQFPPHLKKQLV